MVYRNLIAEMTRAKITPEAMGEKMGLCKVTIYYKINGRVEWKVAQMLQAQAIINEALGTNYTLDYLFTPYEEEGKYCGCKKSSNSPEAGNNL